MVPAALALPTPLLVVLVVGLPILLAVTGLLLVRRLTPHTQLQPHHDVAGYVYTALGVLYAVLLAFVVVVVWGGFNTAQARVHQETDALSTLFRQSQVFPAPVRAAIRAAVMAYARAVVEHEWSTMARGEESQVARQTYEGLWQAIQLVDPRTPIEVNWHAAMLRTLPLLSDSRRDRLVDSREGLSPALWAVLLSGAVINISYTYLFGVRSLAVHLLITAALTAMTTLLLLVILLMDHPFAGAMRLDPAPFVRLLQSLE